jgi:Tfp pilus assembly protein PilF
LRLNFLFPDWALAESRLKQADKLQPRSSAVLNNLAYALVQRRSPEAVPVAQRAVQFTPWAPRFMDTLALAHASVRQVDKALEWQPKAVELAPQVNAYRLQLARLFLSAGDRQKARDALEVLERRGAADVPAAELLQLQRQAQG